MDISYESPHTEAKPSLRPTPPPLRTVKVYNKIRDLYMEQHINTIGTNLPFAQAVRCGDFV